jgi:hypothetical protein
MEVYPPVFLTYARAKRRGNGGEREKRGEI